MFAIASSLSRLSLSCLRPLRFLLPGALLLAALPMSAQATTVLQLNEVQMVSMSTLIVRGKVVSQKVVPGPRGMGAVTLVTIQVAEEMVGRSKPKTIVVRHFGGQLNGRNIRMIGGVSFANNAEVVVFVQQSPYLPKGEYLLVGLNQGKWLVHRPAKNVSLPKAAQEPVLVRSLAHVKMVQQPALKNQGVPSLPARLTLSSMRTRLQKHYKAIVAKRKAKVLVVPKVKLPKVQVKPLKPQVIQPRLVKPAVRRAVPTPVKPRK